MSLLIKNGTVATASDIYKGDIYIEDGVIKEIGINIIKDADEIIDKKMNDNDIRNFINSSSLGVYTKYIKIVDGHKYLVKSGRGDGKNNHLY